MRIERIRQEELLKNEELLNIVTEIYLNKFTYEKEFNLDDVSDIIFFIYYLNDKIIGFGSYQENLAFYLIDCIFRNGYDTEKNELVNHIISKIKTIDNEITICAYEAEESDTDFYLNLGFNLYKDFSIQSPEMFSPGLDLTRFVLELI